MFKRISNSKYQIGFSVSIVILNSLLCFALKDFIDYKVVAFILLVTVSLLAMFFNIIATITGAVLSALIWNYFFIKPYFTFHIENTDDTILFLMYFIIALIHVVLTNKIREIERISTDKETKLKSIVLYNTLLDCLSHELKTPISAIIGSTDALQSKGILSEIQKQKLLEEIAIASMRLNNQVENLLNMSRLDSGVIVPNFDWVDCTELVYHAIRTTKIKLYSQKIKVFVPDDLPLFKLDYGLTEQILNNLLSNAILYTPETSTIRIKIGFISNVLNIEIIDEGNGFPEDEIAYVFDKFYRLKHSRTGGSGLGLSIVKGFVSAQNGTITLENRTEGGAKFTLQFNTEVASFDTLENEYE